MGSGDRSPAGSARAPQGFRIGGHMKLIIMGPLGSGKGTQAKKIAAKYGIAHLSTGEMMRKAVSEGTELGKKLKTVMESGGYVEDRLTTDILKERLEKDGGKGFILDGYPRTLAQVEHLKEISPIDKVLLLDLEDEVILERLGGRLTCESCGQMYHRVNLKPKEEGVCDVCQGSLGQREDDKPEAVKKRLEVYKAHTVPIADLYKSQGMAAEIPGGGDPESTSREIFKILDNL